MDGRRVEQGEFDAAAAELVEALGLSPEEAAETAAEDFAAEGADLSGVVRRAGGAAALEAHPAGLAAEALAAAAAEEGAGAEALRAALGELEGALGAERGEGEPAPAAVAAGKGGVEACLAAAAALEAAGAPWEGALGALGGLLAEELGRNVFHAEGGPRDLLRRARRAAGGEAPDWAAAGALLETLRLSTVKSEENKVELLLGGVGDLAAAVLARAPPAGVVRTICGILKSVLAADDDRPTPEACQATFGGAFAKARQLDKDGATAALLARLQAPGRDPASAGPLCDATRRLAVNDEICRTLTDAGAVRTCLDLLAEPGAGEPAAAPALAKAALGLLRQLCGSDHAKEMFVAEGGVQAALAALAAGGGGSGAAGGGSKGVVEQALGLLGAVVLRNPGHAEYFAEKGGFPALAAALDALPDAAGVQRQGCMLLRNAVVRSGAAREAALAAGAEALARRAKRAHPGPCGDVGAAALRDLGFADYND